MARRDDVIFGAPCWMDLATSDVERATAFYGQLFGWRAEETGPEYGNYILFSKGDARIAGMMPKDENLAGTPDTWTVYLAVQDARATMTAAEQAEGRNHFDPIPVGDLGTMGILTDPSGAVFGIWQPDRHRGFELYGEVGAPLWHELRTREFQAATAFYRQVFGVTLEDADQGGPAYKRIVVDGQPQAGILDASSRLPEGVPSNWLVYYGVEDTDAAVQSVAELGGSVRMSAMDTPFGRFALVADATGAVFAIRAV